MKRKERERKWSARAHRRRRRRRKRDERIGLFAAAKEEGKKEKKIDPSVGRSVVVVVYAGLMARSKTQQERT